MKAPKNCVFHKQHLWCRPTEDGKLLVGISDFAQESLGEIMFFDLPEPGTQLQQGESFGTVESIKIVNDLIAPAPGTVVKCNPALEDQPNIANNDPYGEGWLVIVETGADLSDLMPEDEYLSGVEKE